jgi:ankyrin repeat protein
MKQPSYSELMWDLPLNELAFALTSMDVNKPDEFEDRFLTIACGRLQVESARFLIACGANVDDRNSDQDTPLLCAINVVDHNPDAAHELVVMLLDAGANLEARGYMSKTPFLKACSRGDLEMLKLLVNRGCDVRAVSLEEGDEAPLDALDFANIHQIPTECVQYLQAIFNGQTGA